MIDRRALLADCQRLVRQLEDDLGERLAEHPALEAPLRAEHGEAQEGHRTAQGYGDWRAELLTQVAVHWVLATVFVRFLEDNGLIDERWLSGPGERRNEARERRERFFREQPAATDREYLLGAFRAVAALPAMAPLFDEAHNPLFRLGPSADGARAIVELWLALAEGSAAASAGGAGEAPARLRHDFTDPRLGTRFLGDLYQDLSQAARKRYALLQTPEFVEELLLERTLEPAIRTLGLAAVSLIDPACGSGHFLLGAFARLFAHWQRAEPGSNPRELARRALAQVAGVDLNPFAVAIARFRLLVAALVASDLRRLREAPAFPLQLAAGDSLLHGPRPGLIAGSQRSLLEPEQLAYVYEVEDREELARLLGHKYAVVVGNPPYITPKDPAVNQEVRNRYYSCSGKYSLAVPFTERFFDLAARGEQPGEPAAGWVGMITTNSFMKREFGKKLIEIYLPRWDLTHVIDTSGAYLPGHGTPTVILVGRHRPPTGGTLRAVLGIRGEPGTPEDPAQGVVWRAIVEHLDQPGFESEWVSVVDAPRERFAKHPWSLGGGGAAELKEFLEAESAEKLRACATTIGFGAILGEDEAFGAPPSAPRLRRLPPALRRPLVEGEMVRDWQASSRTTVAFPYGEAIDLVDDQQLRDWLFPLRTVLGARQDFSKKTYNELGRPFWEYHQIPIDRNRVPLSITFAFVATHNHFVLDRGGKVFKQTAPVIKLPAEATEDDHLGLLGLLNSSAACFWMKQVFMDKGNGGIGGGIGDEAWERRYEHDSTKLLQFPLPSERPLALAQELDRLAGEKAASAPGAVLAGAEPPTRASLEAARVRFESLERRMIALQEELDWQVYRLYGLLGAPLEAPAASGGGGPEVPEVALGERAFEIALARKVAAGEVETQWFARHGSTPTTELPARWPAAYRAVVERRLAALAAEADLALLEQPEHKRRWNRDPWEKQQAEALRDWLLDRLEERTLWATPRLQSTARLADELRRDPAFRQVGALYRGSDAFDLAALLEELVVGEAVPYLAAWRYKESGLAKRAEWEETWRRQRQEDAIDERTRLPEGDPAHLDEAAAKAEKAQKVGAIPVPPRYASGDFGKPAYWRLRGALDVPKERFILYPGLESGGDRSPVIGWAGWTALEQAQALGEAYQRLRLDEAWSPERLRPLLAGLDELVPWLRQWFNQPDPSHGSLRLGDYFDGFVDEQCRALGLGRDQLAAWRPPEGGKRRGPR